MSTVLSSTSHSYAVGGSANATGTVSNTATKRNDKTLSSGQIVSLTAQEDRMLKRVYDFMQVSIYCGIHVTKLIFLNLFKGFARRQNIQNKLDIAKHEYNR